MDLLGSLLLFAFFSLFVVSIDANVENARAFIVRVQNDLKPAEFSRVEPWYSSTLRSLSSNPLGFEDPTREMMMKDFIYVYKTVFHGFSAKLTVEQAEELKKRPEILGVFPDQLRQLQTTRSPQFLGLGESATSDGLIRESDSGSNVIIGVLDTGIWPERPSFHDEGLSDVPSRWKGECTDGEKFSKNLCNKKLIGARFFIDGYEGLIGSTNDVIRSARDSEGHGTHTVSTAAGRMVANASLFGYANGTASGMAPKARIAIYKVCWNEGCADSDILAGFDKAVEDGVDVISSSIGGPPLPDYDDPIAIGAFGAMEHGIFVSAAAGNSGPSESSVTNIAPWMTTVGASSIDRSFPADILLGNGSVITGSSLYSGEPLPNNTYLPLIYGGDAAVRSRGPHHQFRGRGSFAGYCLLHALSSKLVKGKIVLCDRGMSGRAEKGLVVKDAGGVGVIVANVEPEGESLIADAQLIPGLAITESSANLLRDYMNSTAKPNATMVFRGTEVGVKPAPIVASFSSRGPSYGSPYVFKPDVIAPGVNILAAWPDLSPTQLPGDNRRTQFNIISGTSMSCPHVSGLAALLKGLHQDWTPGAIRSALMTTAYTQYHDGKPILDDYDYKEATVFFTGAGHVDPEKAGDPGLVYNITSDDYVNFLCASGFSDQSIKIITRRAVNCSGSRELHPWDINYPIISVSLAGKSQLTVTRTATHVSDGGSSYTVTVTSPNGLTVSVDPEKLEFKERGETKSYKVQISAGKTRSLKKAGDKPAIGSLTWTDGKHHVTSPIVVLWKN